MANLGDDSLSEDDAVFTDSEGEQLDYSGESSQEEQEDFISDEDEEEAIETDEDAITAKRIKVREEKRTQKTKRSRFIDTEAIVGEDDEDAVKTESDSEEDNDDEKFVDNEIEERDKEFTAAFQKKLAAHAVRREAARKAFEEEMNPEAVEERLRQLYGRAKRISGDEKATVVTLAAVMQPQTSDPKLWLVKCRPGRERAAVAALIRGLSILGDNLGVYSVIGRDSLKGFIYVEAHKVGEVMNAVQRTKTNHLIFASPINRPIMVPMAEMVDVLSMTMAPSGRISTDISSVQIGSWVRIKRGKYSGDLAQVVEIDQDSNGEVVDHIVRVKLLPRLAYQSGMSHTKEKPSPRPFDPQEAAQYGSVTKTRGFWLYNGEAYKDGFLYKDVRVTSLILRNVLPRPDEVERFGSLLTTDEPGTNETVNDSSALKLTEGEAIIVIKGEFQNLTGLVESILEGDMVEVRFDDQRSFSEPVTIHAKYLNRRFEIGDMIKVVVGDNAGKSGMIVSLIQDQDRRQAVVFSTSDSQQFAVPLHYLIAAAISTEPLVNTRPTKDDKNSCDIHDLVTIENDDSEAGIILRLMEEEKHASVLDMNGQIRKLPLARLRKVPTSSSTVGIKFDSNMFKAGDRVQFLDPNQEVRPATIINVFRQMAFLRTVDSGEILIKSISSLSRPSVYHGISASSSKRMPSRAGPVKHLIGKSVTISGAGPYKGYVGIVKELTDTMARIELHTDCRLVTVSRDRVAISGVAQPIARTVSRNSAWVNDGKASVWNDSRTPAWGGQSSKTPAWGSQSAKTPAWGSSSMNTPAWGSSSARTPAFGSSSAKTPAWGTSSGKTPAWGGLTSRTPALGEGGRTPAWQSVGSGKTSSSLPTWAIPDAEVIIRNGSGQSKIISILPNGKLQIAGQNEPVNVSDLTPVAPAKKDSVRIIGEERAGGTVIGLDGPDAVIRVDGTADFRIVPINNLVKISRQ